MNASEEYFYFDFAGEEVKGPLPLSEICQLWQDGKVSQNVVLTKSGETTDWKNLFYYYHQLFPNESLISDTEIPTPEEKRLLMKPAYVNPFRLFAALGLETQNFDDIDLAVLRRYRKKVLAEFELHDGILVIEDRYEITKSQGLRALEDLDNDEKREFHFNIFKDRLLDEFLECGDLGFFEHSRYESIYRYPPFLEFVTPYFADQFDRRLAALARTNDVPSIKCLAAIEPLVTPTAKERCYSKTYSFLKQQSRDIYDLGRKIETSAAMQNKPSGFKTAITAIKQSIHVETLNALPDYFQSARNETATAIRSVVLALENKCDETEDALTLAYLALKIETDELTKSKLEEDRGELLRRASAKKMKARYASVVARYDALVEKLNTFTKQIEQKAVPAATVEIALQNSLINIEELNALPIEMRYIRDRVATALRNISVEIWNSFGKASLANDMISAAFRLSTNQELAERLLGDKEHIAKIVQQELAHDLTLAIRKDTVEIKSSFVRLNDTRLNTDQISGIRYGVYIHRTNGIQDHCSYMIALTGSSGKRIDIECKRFFRSEAEARKDFHSILDSLYWHTIPHLVERQSKILKSGGEMHIGSCKLTKTGIEVATGILMFQKQFSISYTALVFHSAAGNLNLSSPQYPKFRLTLDFRNIWNAVIFERIAKAMNKP